GSPRLHVPNLRARRSAPHHLMPRSEPGSWQRNVWALSLIVFTAFVGFQFFSPFLPLFVKELGVNDPAEIAVWSGVLMAITPGLAGLLGPLWGGAARPPGSSRACGGGSPTAWAASS